MNDTTTTTTATSTATAAKNLAILIGTIAGRPERRALAGGAAWQFDVATVVEDDGVGRRMSVPVNWVSPTDQEASALVEGVEVLVIGTVRRRFFRVGGQTQSRTEVVPERVIPTRRRATVRSALAAVAEQVC